MKDELRRLEWDSELEEEAKSSLGRVIEAAAAKIDQAIKLEETSLLLGERLTRTQSLNYALLNSAASLATHWPTRSHSLHTLIKFVLLNCS